MLQIEKITRYSDFIKMEACWDDILCKTEHKLAFLSYNFIKTEWANLGWESNSGKKQSPFLLVVRESSEIVAIFPLVREQRKFYGFPLTCIRPLSNTHSDRVDVIIGRKSVDVINSVINYLAVEEPRWSLLMFKNVSESSCIMQYLTKHQKSMKLGLLPGLQSPYVKVDTPWDEYFNDLSKNVRNSLKQKLNRLSREGMRVVTQEYHTVSELEFALERVFEIDSKSWKARGGTALSSTEKSRRYWHSLTKELSKDNQIRIWILWINDNPAAFEYHVVYGDKVYSLKWSYDEEYQRFSPGLILKYSSMKAFWNRNVSEIDLLGSTDSFKLMWADMIRYHYNVYLFNHTYYSELLYCLFFGLRKYLQHIAVLNRNRHPRKPDPLGLISLGTNKYKV